MCNALFSPSTSHYIRFSLCVTAGETAQISATINNESACDVANMLVKLMRFITLVDSHGHRKTMSDCLATASYEGVKAKSSAARHLPLPLRGPGGKNFLSSIKSDHIEIKYQIEVECSIVMAFDIEAHLPVIIYEPAPAVYGLQAAMGGYASPGGTMTSPGGTMTSPGGGYGTVGFQAGGYAGAGAMPSPTMGTPLMGMPGSC